MVPKIHAKGASFKGAAAYLLHDKDRAQSSERVAWTEARNLAVDDPDMGWRIMAATAMDQDRLKANAGVKNTGRKSAKHVLHISLAWHPDETPSREDMTAAADQALKAIGATDRQALIIAHTDEKHPHLHLLINRVSPEDGKHLSSSNDRLKLSKWAEQYERECGHIYCEDRVVNNAMREKGEYIKGERDQARHIFEAQGPLPSPANDNGRLKEARADQRKKDAALALRGRNLAQLHANAREKLAEAHKQRKAAIARAHQADISRTKAEIRDEFRPKWRELNRHQDSERATFEALETSFFGRASNIAKTVRLSARDIGGDTRGIIGRTFGILTNAGDRKAYFEKAQERARIALQRDQEKRTSDATKALKAAQGPKYAANRTVFLEARAKLEETQKLERAALQADWKTRNENRKAAFDEARAKNKARLDLLDAHQKARAELSPREAAMLDHYLKRDFNTARNTPAREQDDKPDRDEDRER
ncbi:MAG: relaxase/mobilization nuclease domain-containing protein [Pseudomonadota bacterium]